MRLLQIISSIALACVTSLSIAHTTDPDTTGSTTLPPLPTDPATCRLITADRVFDGNQVLTAAAVVIQGNKIAQVGTQASLANACIKQSALGNATILPGFIERHGHISFQNVDKRVVLMHGVTTAQDVGGPLKRREGGLGNLRLFSAGPIVQAPSGYPLNVFGGTGGYNKIGIEASSVAEAQTVVQTLVNGGANAVVISLEPGGEPGRHWMTHGHTLPTAPWPMLSAEIVKAIVDKAHALNKRVLAFVGEETGVVRALDAHVDELVHLPCAGISDAVLQRIADSKITVVSTLDTHSSCTEMNSNAMSLGMKGANVVYGAEIAHDNVPWGIDGQELHTMLHTLSGDTIDFADVLNILKAATSKSGADLGIPGLGTLTPGAPADVIAVRGNALERFKILEYPDLVISGGRIVVNRF